MKIKIMNHEFYLVLAWDFTMEYLPLCHYHLKIILYPEIDNIFASKKYSNLLF